MLRVTTALWVAALIRRVYGAGAVAAVMRHGAEEAGAIFILIDRLDGTADLYGPAPQTAFGDDTPSDRKFQRLAELTEMAALSARIEKEVRFDPDLWLVAIEDRAAKPFFDVV